MPFLDNRCSVVAQLVFAAFVGFVLAYYLLSTRDVLPSSILISTSRVSRERLLHLDNGAAIRLSRNEHKGIWEAEGHPIIWTFWDNPASLPAYLKLALASLACHNPNSRLIVVTQRLLYEYVDHVHPAFPLLTGNHKGDYARARLLDEYGGVWADADSIGFAPFDSLLDKLPAYEVVSIAWGPDGDLISITTIGPVQARCQLTVPWVTQLHALLDRRLPELKGHAETSSKPYPITWGELARDIVKQIMERLMKEQSINYFLINGEQTMGQLTIKGKNGRRDVLADLNNQTAGFEFKEAELLMFHQSGMKPEER